MITFFRKKTIFNSQAFQDQFIATLFLFKPNGHCVDIGSAHSRVSNNTYFFESLKWKSLTFEVDKKYTHSYRERAYNRHYNLDATQICFADIFSDNEFPSVIDYLSLDVDHSTCKVLRKLPFDSYQFRAITIEHDSYRFGDMNKLEQRSILEGAGYVRIASDILVPSPGHEGWDGTPCPFEDWWVHQKHFKHDFLSNLSSSMCYPLDFIEKLTNHLSSTYQIN